MMNSSSHSATLRVSGNDASESRTKPSPLGLQFDASLVDRLFPFHLVLDRQLAVVQAGAALRRLLPGLSPPTPLAEHFTLRRPSLPLDFDVFLREVNAIIMLAAQSSPELVLKGQFAALAEDDRLVFLGAPWIRDLDALRRLGLTIADFAVYDSIPDLLVLIQAQKTGLEDSRKLARQLSAMRDAAVQASRVKSEFLANMSHELRTPLNAVIGFSEMMTGEILGPMPKSYLSYAQYIRNSGKMLLDLINDLLDLSRIEAGQYQLEEETASLAAILAECAKVVAAEVTRKNLAIALETQPPGLTLRVDVRAMKQIVLNLLSNAVKFTDPGGRIDVSAAAGESGVVIKVSDTGIGVAPDMIPRLFEPFRQGHAVLSRKYGGTGLGLSICRNLAELHGGSVALESEPGAGTTVTVRLPVARIVRTG
jgi:signal transduction histidine kinase